MGVPVGPIGGRQSKHTRRDSRDSTVSLNRRIVRHGAGLVGLGAVLGSYGDGILGLNAASTITAYVFMLLLASALTWGPIQALRGQPVPASTYTRRDLGIWSAVFGLVHLRLGLDEAMSQPYVEQFVEAASQPPGEEIRRLLFRGGAWSGLIAGGFLLVPLLLSNDWSLAGWAHDGGSGSRVAATSCWR